MRDKSPGTTAICLFISASPVTAWQTTCQTLNHKALGWEDHRGLHQLHWRSGIGHEHLPPHPPTPSPAPKQTFCSACMGPHPHRSYSAKQQEPGGLTTTYARACGRQDWSGQPISGCCADAAPPSTWRGNCFRRAVILRGEATGGQAPSTQFPQKKKKSMSREEGKLIVLTCKRSSEPCLLNCDTHPVADWHSHLSFSSHSNLIVINCYFLTGSTLAFVSSVRTSSHVLLSFSTSLPSLHRRASPPLEESGSLKVKVPSCYKGLIPCHCGSLGGHDLGFPQVPTDNVAQAI